MSHNRTFAALATGAAFCAGLVWLAQASSGSPSPIPEVGEPALLSPWAWCLLAGHCDTLDGPVVSAAKKALNSGNVNFVLIWVQPKDEPEIKRAFREAIEVRKLGTSAKAMADRSFFETLVRVHRAGEGASYEGLKPAGTGVEPAVVAADRALATGSVDPLVKALTHEVEEGLRKHFKEAVAAKKFDPNDVRAGRKFVEAYVEYVHFAERIGAAAASSAHAHFPEKHSGD